MDTGKPAAIGVADSLPAGLYQRTTTEFVTSYLKSIKQPLRVESPERLCYAMEVVPKVGVEPTRDLTPNGF